MPLTAVLCVPLIAGLCMPLTAGLCMPLTAGLCMPLTAGLCMPLTAGLCMPLTAGLCVPLTAGLCMPLTAGLCMPLTAGLCMPLTAVLCCEVNEGGGWTVLQRRNEGKLDFNRGWVSYKRGFGKHGPTAEMWFGNENIYNMTGLLRQGVYLRIELKGTHTEQVGVAEYGDFKVSTIHYCLLLHSTLLSPIETS